MITEDMMRTTEMILMPYFFHMDDWLVGQKTINPEQAKSTKAELLEELKTDFDALLTDDISEYVSELSVAIGTLEEISEEQFQAIKLELLSWEPGVKNDE